MKVLVVDDEPTMARLFQQRFRKEIERGQVSLFFAGSGQEALDLLSRGLVPEFILTDVSMPAMSGLTLLKTLRSQGVTCPVHLISAYDEEGVETESARKLADGYIPKPLNFDIIRKLIVPDTGE